MLGILAFFGSFIVIGGICSALIGLVLGFIASGRAKKGLAGGRGIAIAGIIIDLLAIVISIVVVAVFIGSIFGSDRPRTTADCIERGRRRPGRPSTSASSDFEDELENQTN